MGVKVIKLTEGGRLTLPPVDTSTYYMNGSIIEPFYTAEVPTMADVETLLNEFATAHAVSLKALTAKHASLTKELAALRVQLGKVGKKTPAKKKSRK